MTYSIVLTASFKQSLRQLRRQFRHVKNDVGMAIELLLRMPRLGVVIPGGSGVRKLRVRNSDLTRGKSGGYRLLYCVEEEPHATVYVLLLYAKTGREDVTRRELKRLLDEVAAEKPE